MIDFVLLRPWWLLALIPLATLIAMRLRSSGAGPWAAVVDPHLLSRLLVGGGDGGRSRELLLGTGAVLAVVALAGPSWTGTETPLLTPERPAVVLALDLSRTMETGDVAPSRLERARHKALDLLDRGGGLAFGLVVYAGDAYPVVPVTEDSDIVAGLVRALHSGLMPVQGSRPDRALAEAALLLDGVEARGRYVILISDGRGAEGARTAAGRLSERGITVSTLGVGTLEGGPVDPGTALVTSRLEADALRSLAVAGGGIYAEMAVNGDDLDRLLAAIPERRTLEAAHAAGTADARVEIRRDDGFWFLLPLLLLAALAFRRGWLLVLPLALSLHPVPAEAGGWQGLWWRADQQAERAIERGDYSEAAALATDPVVRGVAWYRLGEYERAVAEFAAADSVVGHYNRGNALVALGRLDEAVAAYGEALGHDPAHRAANFNRRILLHLIDGDGEQVAPAGDFAPAVGREAPGDDGAGLDEAQVVREAGSDPAEEHPSLQPVESPPPEVLPEEAFAGEDAGRTTALAGASPEEGEKIAGQAPTAGPSIAPRASPGRSEMQLPGSGELFLGGVGLPPVVADSDPMEGGVGEGAPSPPSDTGRGQMVADLRDAAGSGEAMSHLLRRIESDPGELLREKFARIQRRRATAPESEPW